MNKDLQKILYSNFTFKHPEKVHLMLGDRPNQEDMNWETIRDETRCFQTLNIEFLFKMFRPYHLKEVTLNLSNKIIFESYKSPTKEVLIPTICSCMNRIELYNPLQTYELKSFSDDRTRLKRFHICYEWSQTAKDGQVTKEVINVRTNKLDIRL